MSQILNSLPIHNLRPDIQRFRNPNAVYMKLCNFLRYDPNYKGIGLKKGNKLEEQVWNEFSSAPKHLHNIAESIISGIADLLVKEDTYISQPLVSIDEQEFPEGKILYRQHIMRERNRKLTNQVKQIAMSHGELRCSVCNFDFYKIYGELGKGYIQCHHTIPLASYAQKSTTKIKDLTLVCANCHCMLHLRRPWLTKDELSKLLSDMEKVTQKKTNTIEKFNKNKVRHGAN